MVNRSPTGSKGEKPRRSPFVFRFRRQPVVENSYISPFTVLPDELKEPRFQPGRFIRRIFNGLLLFILVLALLALIAAFAYQLINNPQMLAEISVQLIQSVKEFLSSFAAVP